jgi:adenine deaminase
MAPSCVPASGFSTAGAALTAEDLLRLRERHGRAIHGLAEVMNFPGVINGDPAVMSKLDAFSDRPIDGHCPQVSGAGLCAYVAAGIGSDHESISPEEAAEKAARGLHVLIREASNAKNLIPLLRAITTANARRFCFCTDDRHPVDLLGEGSIDMLLRRAIEFGVDPMEAFRMATLNAAECHRLPDRGAIAPGRLADLFVFDDLRRPIPRLVMSGGRWIARDGMATFETIARGPLRTSILGRCPVEWSKVDLRVSVGSGRVRVIGVVPEQLVTECRIRELPQAEGFLRTDPSARILKMAVVERHGRGSGSAVGFVEGIGLLRGAIAGTVAHDHHNLVMIGADDASMLTAARAVAESGGGLAAAVGDRVLAHLPLPVAGLMSDLPVEQVRDRYAALLSAVGELGSPPDPFMTMSFMALEVIPALKLTDRGLVDVSKFEFVPLHV